MEYLIQFSSLSHVWLFVTHGLQQARLPCPSTGPGGYSNSCPSSQWCHSIISSSVIPFSSWLQSFPASGSFPMSQFFASGGKVLSFSFSSSPSNEYSGLISLGLMVGFPCIPRDSQESSPTPQLKSISSLVLRSLYSPTLKIHTIKGMVFPVVMYGCESWTIKKTAPKNWCFWTVVLEKSLESPLDC